MREKIIFVHLFNNYSGSPKVLKRVVELAVEQGKSVEVYTSFGEGFLSNIKGVKYKCYAYKPSKFRLLTFIRLLWIQIKLYNSLIKENSATTFYINTVLPFGALIAAKRLGASCVCHIHESYIRPKWFLDFLIEVINRTATKVIFVSKSLKADLTNIRVHSTIIYNALSMEYSCIRKDNIIKRNRKSVLMVSSLAVYKGIFEFIKLAKYRPDVHFTLVLGADLEAIKAFFKNVEIPDNLILFPRQTNVKLFYDRNTIIMNMSNPVTCKESFGLTILEGMSCGCIPFGPNAGGISEIIHEGINGVFIDPEATVSISNALDNVFDNESEYQGMRKKAHLSTKRFSEAWFDKQILEVLKSIKLPKQIYSPFFSPLMKRYSKI